MKNKNETKQVSGLITGYKFALGLTELLLGLGIASVGDRALGLYTSLKQQELLEDPHDLLVDIIDKSIPYLIEHQVAIVIILLSIGIIKMISCIAIWMGKEWGVHLLLFLMLVILPFDLFGLLQNLISSNLGFGSIILNAINIWIILSLTHNHPVRYLKDLDYRNLFSD